MIGPAPEGYLCFRKRGPDLNENGFTQFSTLTVLLLLAAFYGGTYLLTLLIRKEKEDTSGFMVAGHHVGFGMGAASMTMPGPPP